MGHTQSIALGRFGHLNLVHVLATLFSLGIFVSQLSAQPVAVKVEGELNATPKTAEVKRWLSSQEGTQTFQWRSEEGGKATLEIKTELTSSGEVTITEEMYQGSLHQHNLDYYALTIRRFGAGPSYPLIEAQWFKRWAGRADIARWVRSTSELRSAELSKVPQTSELKILRDFAIEQVATLHTMEDAETNHQESEESLHDHLGLSYKSAPERREVKMMNFRGEGQYQLSLIDRRMVLLNHQWLEITEQKIVDDRGRASKAILDPSFVTLTLSLSHEQQLYASARLKHPVPSQSHLFQAKGRLTPAGLESVITNMKEVARPCLGSSRGEEKLAPFWLHTDASGRLDALGYESGAQWTDIQRCVMRLISASGLKLVTEHPTLIRNIKI